MHTSGRKKPQLAVGVSTRPSCEELHSVSLGRGGGLARYGVFQSQSPDQPRLMLRLAPPAVKRRFAALLRPPAGPVRAPPWLARVSYCARRGVSIARAS